MEMILGITLIKDDPEAKGSGSIVPLAFPLIAGAGTLTTILSLRAVYEETNVLIGIFVNLIFVYLVLRSVSWLERVIGQSGFAVLRKVVNQVLLFCAKCLVLYCLPLLLKFLKATYFRGKYLPLFLYRFGKSSNQILICNAGCTYLVYP